MAAKDYHYRGTVIQCDTNQNFGFIKYGRRYALDVEPFLEDLSNAKEHPGKRLRNTLTFLVANGNEPTKELAEQMLEKLF